MAHDGARPRTGDTVVLTLGEESEAEPVFRAEYHIDSAPNRSPTADPREAARIYRTRKVSERWLTPALEAHHNLPARRLGVKVKDGLEVAELAWQFIKDNKPVTHGQGLATSVLAAGTSARDYVGAREGRSAAWILSVRDAAINSVEYMRIRFRLEGAYYATPARIGIPRGHYLPRVCFNVLECSASWPGWIEASALVAGPFERGTAANRIPEIAVYGKFSWGWIGSANHQTCAFHVNGLTGFATEGWRADIPLPPL